MKIRRMKEIALSMIMIGILCGSVGCVGKDPATPTTAKTKPEDLLKMKYDICSKFNLDHVKVTMEMEGRPEKTQIYMYYGIDTPERMYNYHTWVQWRIWEAEQNPQDKILQEQLEQIRSVGQEGRLTLDDLSEKSEKVAAIWALETGPMSQKEQELVFGDFFLVIADETDENGIVINRTLVQQEQSPEGYNYGDW